MSRTMVGSVFLVCRVKRTGSWRGELVFRVTSRAPTLETGEVSIKLDVALPSALFETPQLKARVEIPGNACPQTSVVIGEKVTEAVRAALGADVKITIGGE